MSERKGKKRVCISISSDDEEESEYEDGNSDDDCYEPDGSNFEDSSEEDIYSTSCVDDDDSSSFDNCNGEEDDADGGEDICSKVTRLLREGSQLQELNLIECKTYLRKLRLRVSGTKAECLNRIKEHWRVKDGNGEALYPRSSFNINCTGDVCKGDIVLFMQKVYQKFDKMKRSGNILGKRTIVGRIVKESYGAAKQHTFTVEVLWSKGVKKVPPLFPLLVKGRNLYKMRTFRQRWKNEAERLAVLTEKHQRGAAAREVRALKKSKKKLCTNSGGKRQKIFQHQLSQTCQRAGPDKAKNVHQHQSTRVRIARSNDHHKNSSGVGHRNSKQSTKSKDPRSSKRYQNLTHPHEVRDPVFQSHSSSSQDFCHARPELEHQRKQLSYPYERAHTSSMTKLPHFRSYVYDQTFLASEYRAPIQSTYPQYAYRNPHTARSFSRFPVSMDTYRPFHPYPERRDAY